MRICKVWDADYPWDIRVEKVIRSLESAGHTVYLVCRNQARRRRYEPNGRVVIHRLPSVPSMFGPLNSFINFPYPISPVWVSVIAAAIRDSQADLILVRDLPLALPAIFLGKVYRIPVILDMAENYPGMLEDRLRYTPTGPVGRLIRHPALARLVEHLTVRLVDHIIAVVEESRERLIDLGVPPSRISVVCNTPRLDRRAFESPVPISCEHKENINLVYLGVLDGIRGVDVAIHALRYLKDNGDRVRLTVIGDGPNMQRLRDLAIEVGVGDLVTFTGHLSLGSKHGSSRIQSVMARSHVGLVPHYATQACQTTIPNKLFDYMMQGLPVIVSDVKPMARIVRKEECGEVFRDRDARDLARCVLKLADPRARSLAGARGRAAVHSRYNWDCEAGILLATIEAIASSRNRGLIGGKRPRCEGPGSIHDLRGQNDK